MYDSDENDDQSLFRRIRISIRIALIGVLSFFGAITHWFDRLIQRPRRQTFDEDEKSQKFSVGLNWLPAKLWSGVTWLPGKLLAASDLTERKFRQASQTSSVLGEKITNADSALIRGLKKILSPFTTTASILNQFAILILSKIQAIPIVKKALPVLGRVTYPMVATSAFLSSFIRSRSLASQFWTAAILSALLLSAGSFWFLGSRGRNIPKAYRNAFEKAISEGNFANAQLYQQKLLSLGVNANQSQIQSIVALANSGKMDEAIMLAEELAPVEGFGSPEAHFWLAQTYFAGRASQKTEIENLELIDLHLKKLTDFFQADKRLKMPPNILFLQALVELKKNNLDEGLKILESLTNFWPAVAYLTEANSHLDRDAALGYSQLLLRMVRIDKKILDELDEAFFPVWCKALITEDESSELNEVLGYWHQKFPQNSEAKVEWSLVQLRQVESMIERGSTTQLPEASRLMVEIANRLGKEHYSVLSGWTIPRFTSIGSNSRYLDLAKSVENEPGLTSELAEILGTTALIRNDTGKGVELLKRATVMNSENAIAWNNLAHAIDSSPDLDRSLSAIDLVEKAIRLAPNRNSFRHTRGMIHLKMENWDSAIEDLKLFLLDQPDNRDAHAAIAKAYRAQGDKKLAAFHEELSKR